MSDHDLIPIVNIVGPGSQPEEPQETFDYMPMPSGMTTFETPILPEADEVGDVSAAVALLDQVQQALENYEQSQSPSLFDLSELDRASIQLVNQLLGAGEVSISVDSASPIEIQESVMAGVWRIHHLDQNKQVVGDYIEVAPIPSIVDQLAFQTAQTHVQTDTDDAPQGLINSPALLVEIDEKIQHLPLKEPHVINLTLLPLSPEDLLFLGQRLGVGPVTILSRGYGNCRIGSTACQSVWWIKYFNSEDALILNSIEVGNVPEVALAAVEDIADSAERLSEILELYR